MNKKHITLIIGALVIAGISFYGGTAYAKHKTQSARTAAGTFTQGMRGQFGATGGTMRMGGAGSFTTGEILSKDDKSITVKLQNGGSKIVFLSDSTQLAKAAAATNADLAVGTTVMVTGTSNADGSLTAQSVQIRPATQATR